MELPKFVAPELVQGATAARRDFAVAEVLAAVAEVPVVAVGVLASAVAAPAVALVWPRVRPVLQGQSLASWCRRRSHAPKAQ